MKLPKLTCFLLGLTLVAFFNRSASAAMILTLRPATGATVQAGDFAAIQLFLTGARPTVVASVELEFTPLTGGAQFTTVAPTTDGFGEAALTSSGGALDTVTDGSLLDNTSLGFAAGTSSTGIPIGSEDLLLGTLWVQTPANVAASYQVNIDFAEILSDTIATLPVTTSGLTVQAVIPEPTTLCAIGFVICLIGRSGRSRLSGRTLGRK